MDNSESLARALLIHARAFTMLEVNEIRRYRGQAIAYDEQYLDEVGEKADALLAELEKEVE